MDGNGIMETATETIQKIAVETIMGGKDGNDNCPINGNVFFIK